MQRRRILIITRNFPPLTGGMERLVYHCYRELREEFACDIIGPKGCEDFAEKGDSAAGFRVRPAPLFLAQAFFQALRATSRRRYSLLLAGSGVTAPIAVRIARLRRTRSASFIHGLDLVAENTIYQRFFLPTIRQADLLIANSKNTSRLAASKGFDVDRICIVHPGVTLPKRITGAEDFRRSNGLQDSRLLLSVGRIIPRKGLAAFIEHAMPAIVSRCPDCVLVIIGEAASDALKQSADATRELREAIARNSLDEHVRILGSVDDATLASAYAASDVFVFPVLDIPGDVEGFGMVAVEAAAHGLPTVAFDSGGVGDAVADGLSGRLITAGDYGAMARAVIDVIEGVDHVKWPQGCRSFARGFGWPEYGRRLRQHLRKLIAT